MTTTRFRINGGEWAELTPTSSPIKLLGIEPTEGLVRFSCDPEIIKDGDTIQIAVQVGAPGIAISVADQLAALKRGV